MNINLIGSIMIISIAIIFSVIIIIFMIRDRRRKKVKPESKLMEVKHYRFVDTNIEFGSDERIKYQDYHESGFRLYRVIFLVILGLMLAGIVVNMIHLIIIGGFTDYSWSFYIFFTIVFIVVFNISPIIMWGYNFFAKNFSKGTTISVLTLSVINGLRGFGLGDPVIDYSLISARFLIGLMTAFLPWIYIFMWLAEVLIERRKIEKAKKSILSSNNFYTKYDQQQIDTMLSEIIEEEANEETNTYACSTHNASEAKSKEKTAKNSNIENE